jgi:hypothetical protein
MIGKKVKGNKKAITQKCPVTRGLMLKCTERGFREACDSYRQNVRLKTGTGSNYCEVCKGQVPGEVIFVDMKNYQTGVLKAMSETEKKSCFLCGETKNLKSQYGHEVCAYYQVIRVQAKNRPDVLIKALQK